MIGSISSKSRVALLRCSSSTGRMWYRTSALVLIRLARIARFVPFAITTCLSATIIFATMYLAGLFFESSPEPEKIRIARTCTADAGPPSFLTFLPAETVNIYPHGLTTDGKPAAGKCSAVAICTPRGSMARGGLFDSPIYKAQPEADKEMCWAFATAPENVPKGADPHLYRIIEGADDLGEFSFGRPERSFTQHISFSRWAINLQIVSEQPAAATLPLSDKMDQATPGSKILVMLMSGKTIVTSTPASTRASREGRFDIGRVPRPFQAASGNHVRPGGRHRGSRAGGLRYAGANHHRPLATA